MGYIGTLVLIDSADGVYWYILKSAGILVHSQSEMGYIGTFPLDLAMYLHVDICLYTTRYVESRRYTQFTAMYLCVYS